MGFVPEEMRSIQRWTAPCIRGKVLATLDAKQKIPQNAEGLFKAGSSRVYTQASLGNSSYPLPSSAAFPVCPLSLHLAGNKAVKAVDTISTTPNFGIAFTIWRTPLCPHLHYTHTIINTLLACVKLSGWESMP